MAVPFQSGSWIGSIKPQFTAISPDRQSVYSFDLEGRPIEWYQGARLYKRALDSTVHGRERIGAERRRWIVPTDEAAALFAGVLGRVAGVPLAAAPPLLRERLQRIVGWTPDALLRERARFAAAYEPVTILPPDQYLSVVLQATFGCSWGRCTFCSFYQGRRFRARSQQDLGRHVAAVQTLLGGAAGLRRSIFIADGNALILSNERLRPMFDVARQAFPGRRIAGFVDVFSGEHKSLDAWRALAHWGLHRVYVGLETGHDPLLQWMNKPGSTEEALQLVATLKRAGLAVGAIFLCGAGGARFADAHVRDTVALAARLPLERGDLIYLSPFVEEPGSVYAQQAVDDGVAPLSAAEREAQYARLRDGIRQRLGGLKVARYDIREHIY